MEDKQRELWKTSSCENCRAPCIDEFKKVAGLRNSGLLIFVHKEKRTTGSIKPKRETYILHNAGGKELKRMDYIVEMCQYRSKCFQCKTIIQRVRSLLDEISEIKRNEVLGVCEHCKRANPSGKCRRCEYIVNKFLTNKVKLYEERQERFKTWITNVNNLLHMIMETENICKHKLYKEPSTLELEKLLQELKSPLEMRQPDITFFPTEAGPLQSMTESKEMLEELLIRLRSESLRRWSSEGSFSLSPTKTGCVCKYFMDNKFEERPSMEILYKDTLTLMEPKTDLKTQINDSRESVEAGKDLGSEIQRIKEDPKDPRVNKSLSKENAKVKTKPTIRDKTPGKKDDSPDKEIKKKTPKAEKEPKEGKARKPKLSPEDELLMKMMKERGKEKIKKEKASKTEKVKQFAKIESLPQLKVRKMIEVVEDKSESVVECGGVDDLPNEMIKGAKVVPFHQASASVHRSPLFFRVETVFSEPEAPKPPTVSTTTTTSTVEKKKKSKTKQEEISTTGIIQYKLSNTDFIEKGWTILPTTKIMRRINIYKMEPANPKNNWFERHKNRKIMFYDTSEKLAEIDDNGRGKWFYKNGMVALDYYNAQELNAGQRFVVYSSGEEIENGKVKPVTVLAAFDFLGNGVVYNHYGKLRLKYNQTEGMVIDEKISPPCRWKWHSLNEPPVLQPVFVDTYVHHRNACIDEILKEQDDRSESSKKEQEPNLDMLAIEFENFVKEKANKLLQKYKPFQIRMKALKINDQFALRVLDQANIYLLFRDGPISLKLNLGMLLINSEIVDTDTAEVSEVATPYDRMPPRSSSVAEIQHTLENARRIGNARNNVVPVKKSVTSSG